MKPNHYKIISRCIDDGFAYGYRKAHKYNDAPCEIEIAEKVHDAIMNEICENYDFEIPSFDEDY